jgi:cardiolipin synthase (CMP-forming)
MGTRGSGAFFSMANLLSLSRIPLGALFALIWSTPRVARGASLTILALAALSDVLDGMFARRAARRDPGAERSARPSFHPTVHPTVPAVPRAPGPTAPSGIGAWLDPICDKIFVATVLGAIWARLHPSWLILALILGREVAQAPLALVYVLVPAIRHRLRYDFRASPLGKAATVSQFAALTGLVLGMAATRGLAWVSFGLGMVALGDYLLRAFRMGRVASRRQKVVRETRSTPP